jgi:hypothetical protein
LDGKDSEKETGRQHGENRLIAYVAVAILVALAAVSMLFSSGQGGSSISHCNSYAFQQDRDSCLESLAASTSNASLCASLPSSYADGCYQAIAQNTSNTSICGRISSQSLQGQCYMDQAYSRMDPGICMMINGSSADACIYKLAAQMHNSTACSLIPNSSAQVCYAAVYLGEAIEQGSGAVCSRIVSDNSTAVAESALENVNMSQYYGVDINLTQTLEYDALSSYTIGARDLCYVSVAYRTGNSSYCGYAQDKNLSESCNTTISYALSGSAAVVNSTANFTALLNSCNGQTDSQQCTYGVFYVEAVQSKNVSYCKHIPAPNSYQCYYAMASENNDTSYCSYIGNATLNNDCVSAVDGLFAVNSS